ncbi:MAG: HmuY family protein [Bacteroidia bacterium]|nr:HmuY family protein [Bacteroidia bacterium]MDW8015238.1 HmuY family protein [Bacteroidia bacterium]
MNTRWRAALAILFSLSACRKPEKPWTLPEYTPGRVIEAPTGTEYDTVVFLNLELGQRQGVLRNSWDLMLKAEGAQYEIWLNAAMYAFSAEVSESEWHTLREAVRSLPWRCDLADTAALPPLRQGEARYFLLDRDRGEVFYKQSEKRYRKVAVRWEGQAIQILATSLTEGDTARWLIPVGNNPVFISMDRPGELVPVLPPWRPELLITRYIHPYYDQPEEFRWYPVLGALLGEGVEAAVVHTTEVPYDSMNYIRAERLPFSSQRDVIGYDWKRYDFSTGTYTLDLSRYFVLRTSPMTYYKLRFIDFYDSQGRKGYVRIEYEPI